LNTVSWVGPSFSKSSMLRITQGNSDGGHNRFESFRHEHHPVGTPSRSRSLGFRYKDAVYTVLQCGDRFVDSELASLGYSRGGATMIGNTYMDGGTLTETSFACDM
jgi:hypothetical protein